VVSEGGCDQVSAVRGTDRAFLGFCASQLEKLACGRFSDISSVAAACAARAKGATFARGA